MTYTKVSLAEKVALVVFDTKGKQKGESFDQSLIAALEDFGFSGSIMPEGQMSVDRFFQEDIVSEPKAVDVGEKTLQKEIEPAVHGTLFSLLFMFFHF